MGFNSAFKGLTVPYSSLSSIHFLGLRSGSFQPKQIILLVVYKTAILFVTGFAQSNIHAVSDHKVEPHSTNTDMPVILMLCRPVWVEALE